MEIRIIYFITALISLLVIIGYCKLIRDKERWFIMLYVSVLVVNIGYFVLSVSSTLEMALMANRLAYLGSVFLPLSMMLIIMDVCHVKCSRMITSMMIAVSVVVFVIAASEGFCDWYYENVSLAVVDGVTKLVKVYGPLHKIYYLYLFIYLIAMAVMILTSFMKKKVFDSKHAVLLLIVVFGNMLIWFVEQGLDMNFEFLSISYIITELFLLFLYGMLQDHGIIGCGEEKSEKQEDAEDVPVDLKTYLSELPILEQLTAREMEVLVYLIEDRRRKDIAEELSVTEHTIKKHTAHIFTKLEVTNRRELQEKLGLEKFGVK